MTSRGLADGFLAGFNTGSAHVARQRSDERADAHLGLAQAREERASELGKIQIAGYEQTQKLNDLKLQEAELSLKNSQTEADQRKGMFILNKLSQGFAPSDEDMTWLNAHPSMNPLMWLQPETGEALQVVKDAANPETPTRMNDPRVLAAANHLLDGEINKGSPGKKSIVGVYPGSQSGTLAFDLAVQNEDGSVYQAPMTEGRDKNPDAQVKQVPLESVLNRVKGIEMGRKAFMTPEGQKAVQGMLKAFGVKSNYEAPTIVDGYDEQGREAKFFWDSENGKLVKFGGAKPLNDGKPGKLTSVEGFVYKQGDDGKTYMAMAGDDNWQEMREPGAPSPNGYSEEVEQLRAQFIEDNIKRVDEWFGDSEFDQYGGRTGATVHFGQQFDQLYKTGKLQVADLHPTDGDPPSVVSEASAAPQSEQPKPEVTWETMVTTLAESNNISPEEADAALRQNDRYKGLAPNQDAQAKPNEVAGPFKGSGQSGRNTPSPEARAEQERLSSAEKKIRELGLASKGSRRARRHRVRQQIDAQQFEAGMRKIVEEFNLSEEEQHELLVKAGILKG